jgi:dolichyl-diphosphooligosaccharide--protein glycosyltransferase
MKLKKIFSKEKVKNAFKSLKVLRFRISHGALLVASLLALIAFLAFFLRIMPIRWGYQLSEFDPYYQYRVTQYSVDNGFLAWLDWHDPQRWYRPWAPEGVSVRTTTFPGLPLTAAFFYKIISFLGVPISLYDFCVIFPVLMGTVTCVLMYFVAKDFGGKTVGLLSALFLALNPNYMTRTSLGFFDDETVGIFAIVLFIYLFLRALDDQRSLNSTIKYSVGAGLVLGYLAASWGAALYPIAMTALFAFILILLRRYSQRLLISYSVVFGLGLFIAVNIPRLSLNYLFTWAVLPVFGVFLLLCLSELLRTIERVRWKLICVIGFITLLIAGLVALWVTGHIAGIAGKFVSILNPYERLNIPLVESVQEHRVSAWGTLYYEFGVGILFFGLGLFFALRNPTNRNLFLAIFGLTSLYFAASMVRLTVILAVALCILWAKGIVELLKPFVILLRQTPKPFVSKKLEFKWVGKEYSGAAIFLIFLLLTVTVAFPPGVRSPFSHAYSPVTILAGSAPIRPEEPVTEWLDALNWMKYTLPDDAVVCCWWDYGYWVTILGNKTTLVDNGTLNRTQIQEVARVYMSNETEALKILHKYNVTHVLVFTTFDEQGNDLYYGDEGKWNWMVRIAGFDEKQYGAFNNQTYKWEWSDFGKSTVIYRLMQHAKYRTLKALKGSAIAAPPSPPIDGVNSIFEEAYISRGAPPGKASYNGAVIVVAIYRVVYTG